MYRYLDPRNYVRRAVSLANQHLLSYFELMLCSNPDKPLRHPPIFILGAPRSGSTLAIQIITSAFDLSYISNQHCHCYGAPALAERLFRPLTTKPRLSFHSRHGVTEEMSAPSECGDWWYRFFRKNPAYVSLNEVDPKKMKAFRRSLSAMTKSCDKSILFKNLYASLRIQAIARYIPESLFIVMHRDELDNAHSLLEARMNVFGRYDEWWSMEPQQIEAIKKLPAHEQVVEQIRDIHTTIENDLIQAHVPKDKIFRLQYETLCSDTHATLDALGSYFKVNHCNVKRTGNIPKRFLRREEVRINSDLYSKLQNYVGSV